MTIDPVSQIPRYLTRGQRTEEWTIKGKQFLWPFKRPILAVENARKVESSRQESLPLEYCGVDIMFVAK